MLSVFMQITFAVPFYLLFSLSICFCPRFKKKKATGNKNCMDQMRINSR